MDDGRTRPLVFYLDAHGVNQWSVLAIDIEHRNQFAKKYEEKLRLTYGDKDIRSDSDRAAIAIEDLEARRSGEMIYQRGSTKLRDS